MDEIKVREYIELARLLGYKLTVGQGWVSGALGTRCCCPMGAVLVVQRKGRPPWLDEAIDYVTKAATALRCSEAEVQAFVTGYDGVVLSRSLYPKDRALEALSLGKKFRREALAA